MYKVEYANQPKQMPILETVKEYRPSPDTKNIVSLTIDKEDIMLMIHEQRSHFQGNFYGLYATVRRKEDSAKAYRITNKIWIASIIECDWLVDKDGTTDNYDELLDAAQSEIAECEECSKRLKEKGKNYRYWDDRRVLLEHYTKTIDAKRKLEGDKLETPISSTQLRIEKPVSVMQN